jgi:hypothetical protein
MPLVNASASPVHPSKVYSYTWYTRRASLRSSSVLF